MDLKDLIHGSGMEWLLRHPDLDEKLEKWRRTLEEASQLLQDPDHPLNEESLVREVQRNPHRIAAIVQSLYSDLSPQMLLVAWKVMIGWHIESLVVIYRQGAFFGVTIEICEPTDPTMQETVESGEIKDFPFLRHLGYIAGTSLGPVLDGYYPLRLKD